MAVHDTACAYRMKGDVTAAYLSPRNKRHEQQNHNSKNKKLFHFPPPIYSYIY